MNRASPSIREHWRQIIEQQQNSGLGVAGFCRRQQVAPSSFFAWKRRLAREAQAAPVFVQLTPASVPQPDSPTGSSNGEIELHLGQGRHVVLKPGFDGPTLAAVLAVLSAESSRAEGR
jgi:hypothetical protein